MSRCGAALEAEVTGRSYIIAAADTMMNVPSARLLAEQFPGVKLVRDIDEFGTLPAIDRACEEPGWRPRHSWRHTLAAR